VNPARASDAVGCRKEEPSCDLKSEQKLGQRTIYKSARVFFLSSTSKDPRQADDQSPASAVANLPTLGWALRRAVFGVMLLIVLVSLGAWLFDSGIDPKEAAAGTSAEDSVAAP
jgi:hypothetical protein